MPTIAKMPHVFAFDIDDTLIEQHSFRVQGGPRFNQEEMSKIKSQMAEAIKNGHEVWIVTANWGYKKEDMRKLFHPDPENLLDKIKFYNGVDIGRDLNIPPDKLQVIHDQGLKGKFLAQKIAQDPDLKDYKVNCVLFDDTQSQIDNCATHSTDRIQIQGFRVDDYQAKRGVRPTPAHPLSEVLTDKVRQEAALGKEAASASKWELIRQEMEEATFVPKVSIDSLNLSQVEEHLKAGEIPLKTEGSTALDHCIKSSDPAIKNSAADLLPIYAVKKIMGDLMIPVQVDMVNNRLTAAEGHDPHAMKVTFVTQAQAQVFAVKLFTEYGIYSASLGSGTMKTPQNGSVFLTKDDLEKISSATKLTREPGSGTEAYMTKEAAFVHKDAEEEHTDIVAMSPLRM